MNRSGVLALVLGTGLAALGCGSDALHGNAGTGGASAAGGASGRGGTSGGLDGGVDGGGCEPDLFVDWQIQSPTGAAVTCDAVDAGDVVVGIDGVNYPQICPAGQSSGSQDIPLQQSNTTYVVTINLKDRNGNALAVPQMTMVYVAGCGSYETPGPAILVVAPPAQ